MTKPRQVSEIKEYLESKRIHQYDVEYRKLRSENETLKSRYNELLDDYRHLREQNEFIDGIDIEQVCPEPIEATGNRKTGEATMLLVGSDWHIYERVIPAQVNYLNDYNAEIAKKSVDEFFTAGLRWTEIHRGGVKINKLILALLGDIISGQLHQDQLEGNEGTPQEEVLFALNLITGGIDYLVENGGFDEIHIVCCDGNHGRATERMFIANRVKHSNEWLMYKFLEKIYADHDTVRFSTAEGYHLYKTVYGREVRFHHGDAVSYQGGIGGLSIPMNKAIAAWDKERRAEYDVFGHFHTHVEDKKFFSNGSILGYSAYSKRIKASYQPPMQGAILINSDRWINSVNRIYVR